MGKVLVVLVRGLVDVRGSVKETLRHLGLTRVNQAAVHSDSPILRGKLQKVKDYATWGPIDDGSFSELLEKRGEAFLGRTSDSKGKYTYTGFFEVAGKKYKKTFRLNPPRKGYGRKGIKKPFKTGGALGFRGEAVVDLMKRML